MLSVSNNSGEDSHRALRREESRQAAITLLCLIDGECPSVNIGLRQPLGFLQSEGRLSYAIVPVSRVRKTDLAAASHVLFMRSGDPVNQFWFDLALRMGKRVLYFIDDNYFGLSADTPLGRYYAHPSVVATVRMLLDHSDLVLLGSAVMREEMHVMAERSVYLPSACPDVPELSQPSDDELVIGFSGTPGHRPDFEHVIPALAAIAASGEYPVRIEICGISSLPRLASLGDKVAFVPYDEDYNRFIGNMPKRNWSIGLAPLLDNAHNRCKTDNKYRDYAACGIPGIYSDVPPFNGRVEDGHTGVLAANTTASWNMAIRRLVGNPQLRESIRENALADVLTRNATRVVARHWLDDVFARLEEMSQNAYAVQARHPVTRARALLRQTRLLIKDGLRTSTPDFILNSYRRWRRGDWGGE